MAASVHSKRVKTIVHRPWWFAICLCLILAFALAGWSWHSRHQARTAVWDVALRSALPLDGPIQKFPTAELEPILSGGPAAVTYLLDRLEGTLTQRIATRFSGRFPIFNKFAYAPDLSTQNSIPIVLEQMGVVAVGHLPRMRRIFLAGPAAHLNLLNAMGKIGREDPETGAFLIRVGLDLSMPASVRGNCAAFLGTRKFSEEIVEALMQFYSDPDPDVRRYACTALGKHGPTARRAIPLLVSALSNPDPDVRRAAIRSLAQIETNTVVLTPLLSPLTFDPNKDVSSIAKRVLSKLDK